MSEMAVSTPAEARLRTAALRLKSALAAAQVMTVGRRVVALLRKANFDPDQPRVPAGNPDGGQWTDEEGGRNDQARVQLAANEPPPEIPRIRPPRSSMSWPVVKQVARWAFRIGIRATPIGRALDLIQAAEWIYDYAPYVQAYLDGPTALDELQQAVSEPKRGYDVHHIVERTPGLNDGFSRALVDGAENLVRIPTLKHWELNAWYGRPNEDYGGLSPRDYLRGKSWTERYEVGLHGLIMIGVLKP